MQHLGGHFRSCRLLVMTMIVLVQTPHAKPTDLGGEVARE
jgi:hypothetical protein